ncbi:MULTISPECIES: DUF305 domain-containing protein [Microbacterium]|uniref:DUF305 domain-containing protein n=1 Tax=Microbacterium invictum TaxID=515415 RepID=A0ABZ0VC19_9MICO|nr:MULTISPECIES: DUF305 domain-containing protein [Microbacterium]PZT86963.1 MAG: DUF305 domain-containing protein [Gordonia sp. (in: high G+C Gram-positive bacteria)]WQB71024.1 DUF305 domain-containing protein [Microbacterium invictum]
MSRSETSDASPSRGWPRWWIVVLILLAVGALTFAAGRFSTFGSQGAGTPGTDSPEAGFSRDMQVHHAQAIQMAMEIYRKTSDEELRIFAYDIATGQAGQRGEMYDWLVQWGLSQSGGPMMQWMDASPGGSDHAMSDGAAMTEEEARIAMGMASSEEISALEGATGQQADCLFLGLLTRHHEGAIPMAEALIELGTDPRALTVAENIKNGQTAEISAMKSMQARIGCE